MNEMQIFNNHEFGDIRTVIHEGKSYAVGVDVARALEYTKPSQAVIDHCKGIRKLGIPSYNQHGAEVIQETNIIPKGDIYRLIVKAAGQSKNPHIKEKAERFERWIFDEVLVSIGDHGAYMTSAKIEEVLLNPDTIIHLATQLKSEREQKERLSLEVARKDQIIGELKPKADYVDWILQNPGLVTITQIAKDYGMSGNRLNKILHELEVQFKQGGQWLLYKKYHDKGYTHSETVDITRSDGRPDLKMHTKWTQKGRLFIYNLLKDERGILPVIERLKSA